MPAVSLISVPASPAVEQTALPIAHGRCVSVLLIVAAPRPVPFFSIFKIFPHYPALH
jgi:hypothetical protein